MIADNDAKMQVYTLIIYTLNITVAAKWGFGMTGQEICINCGMEIARSSHYQNLCAACERSMSEEEIFAIMDSE